MAAVPGVRRSELGDALRACRGAFVGVGVMSCMINLLYLTGSLFMLEVYDRVLPSRSVPTLVGLAILAGGLYTAQGILDLIRAQFQSYDGDRRENHDCRGRTPGRTRRDRARPGAYAQRVREAYFPGRGLREED